MAQGLHRVDFVFQLLRQISKLLHLASINRLEQGFSGGEVPVQRTDTDAGSLCNSFEAGLGPARSKDSFGRLEDAFAIANGVGSRLARLSGRVLHAACPRGPLKSGGILRICAALHLPASRKNSAPAFRTASGLLNQGVDRFRSARQRGAAPSSVKCFRITFLEPRMPLSMTVNVNGVTRTIDLDDPRVTLLDLLRERLELTGTKKGCDRGQCGACTVIVDGRRINSCLALAVSHDGAEILTIEGVAQGNRLHPVQEAFLAHDGLQCGFCTPGQIMSTIGLIHEGDAGDDAERVREGMSGNLCRCGAYQGITEAVLEAQKAIDAASRKEVA
jgi:xanthine dehydrogenase YagT iron-sulfur-binding subunit